eukprot:COSAG05_NODE_738_length_7631_cov_2086.673128_5_plen_338_part_00
MLRPSIPIRWSSTLASPLWLSTLYTRLRCSWNSHRPGSPQAGCNSGSLRPRSTGQGTRPCSRKRSPLELSARPTLYAAAGFRATTESLRCFGPHPQPQPSSTCPPGRIPHPVNHPMRTQPGSESCHALGHGSLRPEEEELVHHRGFRPHSLRAATAAQDHAPGEFQIDPAASIFPCAGGIRTDPSTPRPADERSAGRPSKAISGQQWPRWALALLATLCAAAACTTMVQGELRTTAGMIMSQVEPAMARSEGTTVSKSGLLTLVRAFCLSCLPCVSPTSLCATFSPPSPPPHFTPLPQCVFLARLVLSDSSFSLIASVRGISSPPSARVRILRWNPG